MSHAHKKSGAAGSNQAPADLVKEVERLRERVAHLEKDLAARPRVGNSADEASGSLTPDPAYLVKVFQHAPVGLAVFDRRLRYVLVNDSLARYNGRPVKDHLGKTLRDVVPELAGYAEPIFEEVFEKGIPILNREVFGRAGVAPEAARHWLASYFPVADPDGSVRYVCAVAQDITERKRADHALRVSAQLTRRILDCMPGGIVEVDTKGAIVETNVEAQRILGLSYDEITQRFVSDFEPFTVWEDGTPCKAEEYPITRCLETGQPQPPTIIGVSRPDGDMSWSLYSAIPVFDPDSRALQGAVVTFVDVTAQKKALIELQEHRRSLDTLLSNLPGMAYRCHNDPDWTMEFVSEGCLELTGYTPADLINNHAVAYASLIHTDDYQKVWNDVQQALAQRAVFRLTYRIVTADKRVRWVWEQGRGVFAADGRLEAVEGFITDISDRRRIEQELIDAHRALERRVDERTADLRRTERNLRLIAENTSDVVFAFDMDRGLLYVNPAFTTLTGYSVDELRERQFINYVYPDDTARMMELWNGVFQGKAFDGEEFRIITRDGQLKWCLSSWGPLLDAKGVQVGVQGRESDITARKHAELALRESEERLNAIIDNSIAVIYLKDVRGRYMLINRRFSDIFEMPRESVIGRSDDELFSREFAEGFQVNDRRVISEGRPLEFEEVAPHVDGDHYYISVKFPLFNTAGEVYAVCGISTDISDRKRAETALREASEAAESANRAKSTFLANVSHEIRTPINAMLAAAELLQHTDNDPALVAHRLNIILRNGGHLLSLVDDLLDLARLDAGRLEANRTFCCLTDIFSDVQAVTAPLHDNERVEFRFIHETEVPEVIYTDPTRLKQAMINLINNALKFCDAGHVHVRISARREGEEPRLAIAVEDTGHGIPAADLPHIFKAFTQGDVREARIAKGIGLGLTISRWIADQLGGDLSVASTFDVGSCFTLRVATGAMQGVSWLTLPDVTIQPHSAVSSTLGAKGGPKLAGRVLIAEDFSDARELLSYALTRAGAEVVAVENGQQAVDAAQELEFDLILMDLRMPLMDGQAAAAELRRRGCLAPIIALSASAAGREPEELYEVGFDEYWPKPISMEQLLQRAASYLRVQPEKPGENEVRKSLPMGDPRMAALVRDFVESLPARMERLRESAIAGQWDVVDEVLHQLTGTCGILGFMTLSHEARRLMNQLRQGQRHQGGDAIGPLQGLVNEVVANWSRDQDHEVSPSDPPPPTRSPSPRPR